jgi:hypothetical protein
VVWLWVAYQLILQAAKQYGDFVEATFDTHRFLLYRAMHWPLPEASGNDEILQGERLTQFLWRGTIEGAIEFEHPK